MRYFFVRIEYITSHYRNNDCKSILKLHNPFCCLLFATFYKSVITICDDFTYYRTIILLFIFSSRLRNNIWSPSLYKFIYFTEADQLFMGRNIPFLYNWMQKHPRGVRISTNSSLQR